MFPVAREDTAPEFPVGRNSARSVAVTVRQAAALWRLPDGFVVLCFDCIKTEVGEAGSVGGYDANRESQIVS